jgi:hypothetical protein
VQPLSGGASRAWVAEPPPRERCIDDQAEIVQAARPDAHGEDRRELHRGARGLRAVGEHPDGFAVSASKTVDVPVDRLYDAFVDESLRARWLPDAQLRERTATKPKSARFDWGEDGGRVLVTFAAKGEVKSVVAVQHARLADAAEADRMKAYWRERLSALKADLAFDA